MMWHCGDYLTTVSETQNEFLQNNHWRCYKWGQSSPYKLLLWGCVRPNHKF